MFTRRNFILLILLIITTVGCQTAVPETVEVEVTRIVEVPVETEATESLSIFPGFPTDVRTYHSEITDRDYVVYVVVPDSYETLSKSYPVLYVTDGDFYTLSTALVAGMLAFDGEMPEVITVGIGYGGSTGNSMQRRQADMMTFSSESFLRFIQEELIPDIEANYRVDSSDRALMGYSLGGAFSLYALFNASDTFNRVVAGSPAFDYTTFEETYAEDHDALPARLFVSEGEFDTVPALERFENTLETSNYDGLASKFVTLDGETHMSSWPRAFTTGLRWVYSEDE